MTKATWGEGGLFHLTVPRDSPFMTEVRARTQDRKECRSCGRALLAGLFLCLAQPAYSTKIASLGVAMLMVNWALPQQSAIKKSNSGLAHRPD